MTCRSRIRELKPRVEPPKDRPVQFFFKNGTAGIYAANDRELVGVVAWCLPAQLDGTPSGPVHSLEAQELPAAGVRVLMRVPPRMGSHPGEWTQCGWFAGYRSDGDVWIAMTPTQLAAVTPDAWRPLPDDEPGDAELLEAARKVVGNNAPGWSESTLALADIVRKRGGK